MRKAVHAADKRQLDLADAPVAVGGEKEVVMVDGASVLIVEQGAHALGDMLDVAHVSVRDDFDHARVEVSCLLCHQHLASELSVLGVPHHDREVRMFFLRVAVKLLDERRDLVPVVEEVLPVFLPQPVVAALGDVRREARAFTLRTGVVHPIDADLRIEGLQLAVQRPGLGVVAVFLVAEAAPDVHREPACVRGVRHLLELRAGELPFAPLRELPARIRLGCHRGHAVVEFLVERKVGPVPAAEAGDGRAVGAQMQRHVARPVRSVERLPGLPASARALAEVEVRAVVVVEPRDLDGILAVALRRADGDGGL